MASAGKATVWGGIPAVHRGFYREIRFSVGDPAALICLPNDAREHPGKRILLLRDIEIDRAKRHARADMVGCPAEYAPAGGLSGDRETATAQAVAELLSREGVKQVRSDRGLPLIFSHFMRSRAIDVECDPDLGVVDRRRKDAEEIEHLRKAQDVTEQAVRMACELIARATAGAGGGLMHAGEPLTAERVRFEIDVVLLRQGFLNEASIVAGGPQGADCHDRGTGVLFTGQPVIVDIFPRDRSSLYNGDCTRTVVHGEIPPEVERMHAAVCAAKAAAIRACRAGVTGEAVHQATIDSLRAAGYAIGLPPEGAPDTYCAMTHGTGHGVGLDVHEPPLLDFRGPPLVVGDALTIEPGLYCRAYGGIRVEDMVIVEHDGCRNLNRLPEGLGWR